MLSVTVAAFTTGYQKYNAEVGKTAVVRCQINNIPDFPQWIFYFPNQTSIRATITEVFNPSIPSYGRIEWVDGKHLEIRSVTWADQGRFFCQDGKNATWNVQLVVTGASMNIFNQ